MSLGQGYSSARHSRRGIDLTLVAVVLLGIAAVCYAAVFVLEIAHLIAQSV